MPQYNGTMVSPSLQWFQLSESECSENSTHTIGAATGKAREENTIVAGSCCSSKAEADRRFLVGRYS